MPHPQSQREAVVPSGPWTHSSSGRASHAPGRSPLSHGQCPSPPDPGTELSGPSALCRQDDARTCREPHGSRPPRGLGRWWVRRRDWNARLCNRQTDEERPRLHTPHAPFGRHAAGKVPSAWGPGAAQRGSRTHRPPADLQSFQRQPRKSQSSTIASLGSSLSTCPF